MEPPNSLVEHLRAQMLERADDLSAALVTLLEGMAPETRAAFLMCELFDAGDAELARMLGLTPAACRELVRRAKRQLRARLPR